MISDLHLNRLLVKKSKMKLKLLGYDYAMMKLHMFSCTVSGTLYHLGLFEQRICRRPCALMIGNIKWNQGGHDCAYRRGCCASPSGHGDDEAWRCTRSINVISTAALDIIMIGGHTHMRFHPYDCCEACESSRLFFADSSSSLLANQPIVSCHCRCDRSRKQRCRG